MAESERSAFHAELLEELGPPTWVWRLLAITSTIALVVVAIIAGFTAVTLVHRIGDVSRSSARADCRAELAGVYAELRDDRDGLRARSAAQFNELVLAFASGAKVTDLDPELLTWYATTNAKLDAAIEAVDVLPPIDEAIARGVTIQGRRIGACPAV